MPTNQHTINTQPVQTFIPNLAYMKTLTIILALLCCLQLSVNAQETELDKRNGFKDIKLGTPVDSVKGVKFKKDFEERKDTPAKLYTVEHPDYATIGDIKVKDIELKAYRGLIYQITVITEKDTRLMKAMEKALGKAEYNVRTEQYVWVGKDLSLTFQSASKNELKLVYSSNPMYKMMREDKEKKVDEISSDF